MRRIFSRLTLAVVAVSLTSCAATEEKATSTAATPAAASPTENVEQALMKLEREWAEALVKADTAALDRLMADDWSMTTWDGRTQTKAQSIEEFKSGVVKLETANVDSLKVRTFGDVAIVTLGQTEQGTNKGKDSSGRFLYTDVWVKRKGQWQAVATHGTKVEQPKQNKRANGA
jgi:uncharacterized protein (TIGR02246 family)